MYKNNFSVKSRGLDACHHQPHLVGDIIMEMLSSDSPLATGYRRHMAYDKENAEKGGCRHA